MSSKVTNPRCVWCKATASFFYVSDCSSILLLRGALHRIRRYPRQASKQTRSEARAHTNTHKRAVLFCLAHKHTAKRPGTYSHSSTKNSPSSIIPSRYYPITSMHQFHSHKFNCCFYWGYAIRSRIMHESLGFCNTLINLLKLTSTQIWLEKNRSFLLARHPSHVRYYSIMYMHQFHGCKLFLFLLVLCL
jgi:hypothetical protein